MPQLELSNITIRYGHDEPVVRDLTLDIERGTFCAIVGPSGSGKSSVLKVIGGFISPSTGRVILSGRDVTHVRAEKRHIGVVFQDYALFPHMTVADNVAYGLRVRKVAKRTIALQVNEYLDLVGLAGFGSRYPDQLSGGQQQRVALARALIVEPEILLLDEPLSALDRKIREEMQGELRRIQRETGTTALIVTHDQQEALSLGDNLAVLRGGEIQQVGGPHAVYQSPANLFVADFVGSINRIRCVPAAQPGTFELDQHGAAIRPGQVQPDLQVDGDIVMAFRPEESTLSAEPAGDGGSISIPGTVATRLHNGQYTQFRVDTNAGNMTVTYLSSQVPDFEHGNRVNVTVKLTDIKVFNA